MDWLKKIGQGIAVGINLLTGLGPLFNNQNFNAGRVIDTLSKVMDIIIGVEAFGAVLTTPGPDKLKAATPLVAQVILQSDMLVGKKVKNKELFLQGSTKIADGMVDILKSLETD